MTNFGDQHLVANYTGALAHLLGGCPGCQRAFIQNVSPIISGTEPSGEMLMQFANHVRRTRRPVLWVGLAQDRVNVPAIGLVAMVGKNLQIVEHCMLWMSETGDRALLVPDNFRCGAFLFDRNFNLRFLPKVPSRSFEAAASAMSRAYVRLREIEADQLMRGEVFDLPQLARAA